MNYEERLQNVTVLGAAGKMGSGILLLTAVEMADLSLMPENKGKTFVLNAVDVSDEALHGLMGYLRTQVRKIAEKKTVLLRKLYADRADLIENFDIIDEYIFDVMNIVRPVNAMEVAYNSHMIFEAIKEDPALKVKIFTQIKNNSNVDPWFFTNTSSIPITEIDEKANLGGKVIGFHFYNPPAVQKLVEVIRAKGTLDEVNEFAMTYAKRLRKVVVPSNDFAGFIGNGHFMRDALYGIQQAVNMSSDFGGFVQSIYAFNKVTQDYLVRPMGIFQLIDYVGVEVCSYIMSVMNPYLENEDLHSDILDKMVEQGVTGGQYSSGAQKDGFLKYEKGRPVAIWDIDKKEYLAIADFSADVDAKLGDMPASMKPWKAVNFNRGKAAILDGIFEEMNKMDSLGAKLAKAYNKRSNEIGNLLVDSKVANSTDDVNTVMLTGFYHAYGPINNYLK
jgi:3-hydroxyacyl-CoA dehydrogenase